MLTFVKPNPRLEEDSVVVRHEFGHALAAFTLGLGVGRIAFARQADMVLAGSARSRVPDIKPPEYKLDQITVTRLLAGEIAGRKYLGMTQDEFCTDFDLSDRHHFHYAKSVAHGGLDDISKALSYACKYGHEWYSFLSKCHEQAKTIVESGWEGIEGMSAITERTGLPDIQGATLLIPGIEAIRAFERSGCTPGRGLAVEAVHHELLGSPYLRMIRALRKHVAQNLLVENDDSETADFPKYL